MAEKEEISPSTSFHSGEEIRGTNLPVQGESFNHLRYEQTEELIDALTKAYSGRMNNGIQGDMIRLPVLLFKLMNIRLQDAYYVISTALRSAEKKEGEKELEEYIRAFYSTKPHLLPDLRTVLEDIDACLGRETGEVFRKVLGINLPVITEGKMTAKQICELDAEISWLIPGLIPRYGVVVLAGKGGVGKSFLALHIAKCLLKGDKFLDLVDVRKSGKILIMDKENDLAVLKARLKMMDMADLESLIIYPNPDVFIDQEKGIEFIEQEIRAEKPDLVILDSWTQFLSRTDENNPIQVNNVIMSLRKLAQEHNVCFLIIHHLRKSQFYAVEQIDELRGSSALVNAVDAVILLRGGGVEKTINTVKNRMGTPKHYSLDFIVDEGKMLIKGREIESPREITALIKCADEVKEYIRRAGGRATRREIKDNMNYSERTVDRAIQYLMSRGELIKVERGVYALKEAIPIEIGEEE